MLTATLVALTGCSRTVDGTARPDPRKPGTVLTEDGYGIVAGFDDAPVNVEIFTEPQCEHCADLQADFGAEIARYINLGQLTVTYRPMTFLDDTPDGYSARVSNALFLAADPQTSATAFQAFVQALYAQHPSGDGEIADVARQAGIAPPGVERIAGGESALDVADMSNTNFGYLFELSPLDAGTPTVYDPAGDEVLDIYDNNWLSKLMASA